MNIMRARAGKFQVECTEDTLCGIPRSRSMKKDRNKVHKRFDFAYIHYKGLTSESSEREVASRRHFLYIRQGISDPRC